MRTTPIFRIAASVFRQTKGFLPHVAIGGNRALRTFPTIEAQPLNRFAKLPGVLDNCFLTYIWIDGTGEHIRSKQQTVEREPMSIEEVKPWGFDGSSTGQAVGHDSDMILKPARMIPDPFFPGPSKIVLCEVYDKDGNPTKCAKVVAECGAEDPWFGMEQEYTMLSTDMKPLGFPVHGHPAPQGPYYCSVGAGRAVGRELCDAHYLACTYSGLTINGTNAEVLLGQWEYQIGPSPGIDVADELWLARYIMDRMGEDYGVAITLDPKPMSGDWNGTGNHANFSTESMRQDGGLKHIEAAIEKLSKVHDLHIRDYDPRDGEDNKRRLTGLHETASIYEFTAAAGSRNVSIRIPRAVHIAGKVGVRIDLPGEDNKRRLTGLHETASIYEFTAAAGSRNVSIRIPRAVHIAGKVGGRIDLPGEDNKRRLTGLHETASIYEFTAAAGSRNVSIRIPRAVHIAGNVGGRIDLPGEDNKRRLTGLHETASIYEFTAAAGSRNVSIRIPRAVHIAGKVGGPIDLPGEDNKRRLTGLHETASIYEFTAAAGSRNVSIRIPRAVHIAGKVGGRIDLPGEDNKRRLTGLHETASIYEFTAAAGSRNVSIRIPRAVHIAGKVGGRIDLPGEDNKRRLTGLHETASIYEFTAAAGSRNVSIRIPRAVHIAGKVAGRIDER